MRGTSRAQDESTVYLVTSIEFESSALSLAISATCPLIFCSVPRASTPLRHAVERNIAAREKSGLPAVLAVRESAYSYEYPAEMSWDAFPNTVLGSPMSAREMDSGTSSSEAESYALAISRAVERPSSSLRMRFDLASLL